MTSVKVKRLEWKTGTYGNALWHYADTPFGIFDAYKEGKQVWAVFRSVGGGTVSLLVRPNTRNLETAKRRCQAYFERLVLECLEVDNDPE